MHRPIRSSSSEEEVCTVALEELGKQVSRKQVSHRRELHRQGHRIRELHRWGIGKQVSHRRELRRQGPRMREQGLHKRVFGT